MRYSGYCPNCGNMGEHLRSKDKQFYFCLQCGSRSEVRDLEDIWYTFNLSRA
jgi:uncharacterized protein (DUF983 family)